ncbi:MAG: hypothetical protein AAFV88_15180 [Planctomycetota bacterium]
MNISRALLPAFATCVLVSLLLASPQAKGQSAVAVSAPAKSDGDWSPIVLPTGAYRQQIKALPIEQRPGRLLHVYGNTIRMIDQAERGAPVRPFRQIVVGATRLRGLAGGR